MRTWRWFRTCRENDSEDVVDENVEMVRTCRENDSEDVVNENVED